MTSDERGVISRRGLLRQTAAGAAMAATPLGRLLAGEAEPKAPTKKIPIGVQLYSVRRQASKDLPKVLEAIGKMGYAGVEFAGYYGWDKKPKALRKLLDDNGLKCCGTHTGLRTISGDRLKATAELHKVLGNRFLIVPGMGARGIDGWKKRAGEFNEAAVKAKALGMLVGYHAHGGDFRKLDGTTPWEVFFDHTVKDVVMQMDTGNCLRGGGDPVAILKKYPGRSKTIHLKECGGPRGAVIGEGKIPWKQVFEVCETTGGTEWYIVEHETGKDPLDAVKRCLDALRKMGR